jgi:hypothetical protein
MWERMRGDLAGRMHAWRFTYQELSDLGAALEKFRQRGEDARHAKRISVPMLQSRKISPQRTHRGLGLRPSAATKRESQPKRSPAAKVRKA